MLCQQNNSQLIVIDMQSSLLDTMQLDDKERVIRNVNILIESAALFEIPVFVTEQYPKGLGGTDDALKKTIAGKAIFEKTCFSCMGAEDLNRQLAQSSRNQFILCGIEAHVCVLQTAMELIGLGKEVFVVEDAVCSRSGLNKKNALARLHQSNGVISNMESVLFEWLRDSKHTHFKEISRLIR